MKIFYTFFAAMLLTSYASAEENNNLLVTAGTYQGQDNNESPLILTKTGAADWTQIKDIANIPVGEGLKLHPTSVSLSTQFSLISGSYYLKNYITLPLLLVSTDHAKKWSFATVSSLPKIKYLNLNANLCDEDTCLAVGDFQLKGQSFHAAILRMQPNNPLDWSFYNASAHLPKNIIDTSLLDVKCTAEWCVAVGSSLTNQQRTQPLIYSSTDHGQTWTYHDIYFPYLNGDIRSVACKGKTCFGSGIYLDSYNLVPIITSTLDEGLTWHFTKFQLPDDNDCQIIQVTFAKNHWLGVGFYHDNHDFTKTTPLIITSSDQGQTWQPAKLPTLNEAHWMGLKQVACVGNHCTAVGTSYSEDQSRILILTSENDGLSWTRVENVNNYPANLNLTSIEYPQTLYCSINGCTSVKNFVKDKNTSLPGILSHQKKGEWNLSLPPMNTQYSSAELTAIGGTAS